MLRVLVADRDDTIRAGIRSLLAARPHISTVDEVRSQFELVERLKHGRFDLVVVELLIADGQADTLLRSIRDAAPEANILVFTALDEAVYGVRAITYGAKGFLMKTCSVDEFLGAVDRVGRGRVSISAGLAERCAKASGHYAPDALYDTLSEREIDVYSMLVAGKTVSEIARQLHLSVKTVSTHKGRILSKVACRSLTDIVKHAITHELVGRCQERSAALLRQ